MKQRNIGIREPESKLSECVRDVKRGGWVVVPVTETVVARAEAIAWAHGLRGDDPVQLASALAWQDALGEEVVVATFDRQLWEVASEEGLRAWPTTLPN